jgi:hypothetical protein
VPNSIQPLACPFVPCSGGNMTKVTADEASSRVVERYDGRHSYVECIPSRFSDEAT